MKAVLARILAISCVSTVWSITPTYASPVTWEFTGVPDLSVYGQETIFGEDFALDTPISWQITFDSAVSDGHPTDPNIGSYWNNILSISGYVGGTYFEKEPERTTLIWVSNDDDTFYFLLDPIDTLEISSYINISDKIFSLEIKILDFTGSMLSNDHLPFNPQDYSINGSAIFSIDAVSGEAGINGHILSIVPDPCTLTLFAIGAFACLKRRRVVKRYCCSVQVTGIFITETQW